MERLEVEVLDDADDAPPASADLDSLAEGLRPAHLAHQGLVHQPVGSHIREQLGGKVAPLENLQSHHLDEVVADGLIEHPCLLERALIALDLREAHGGVLTHHQH